MKACANCGTPNPDDAAQCTNCGAQLNQAPQMMPTGAVPQQPVDPSQAMPTGAIPQGAPQMMPTGAIPQGAPQMMPTGAIPQGAPQAGAPVAAKKPVKKGPIIAIAIAVVVIVIAVIATVKVVGNMSDPENVVNDYVTALSDGRYGDAIGMEDSSLTDQQKALLVNSIMKDPGDRISNVRVSEGGSKSGSTRSFKIKYSFGDQDQSATITLKKDGKKGLVDKWKFTKSMLSDIFIVYPKSTNPTITINDVTVGGDNSYYDAKDLDLSSMYYSSSTTYAFYRFAAYPGKYDVSFSGGSKYVALSTDSSDAKATSSYVNIATPKDDDDSDNQTYVSDRALVVYPIVTDDLTKDLGSQLKKAYGSCIDTANSGKEPDDTCDIYWSSNHSDSSYTNWKYSVGSDPELSSTYFSSDQSDDGTINGTFTATAKYDYSYTFNWSDGDTDDYSNTSYSYLYGTFSIKGDDLTVKLTDSSY
ncbi:MAG: hypothetical protein PUF97_06210 [Bifidobacteriaceae bacterium]|nr:hypothetical protein [Bifidobacteriaceae bacterium]